MLYVNLTSYSYLSSMTHPSNIKEVFLPLANRLLFFESSEYLQTSFYKVYLNEDEDFPYESMIKHLTIVANLFDGDELKDEVTKYEKIISDVLKDLKPKVKEHKIIVGSNHPTEVEVSAERQKGLMEEWQDELYTYLEHLAILKSHPSGHISKPIKNDSSGSISLPENFSFEDLRRLSKPYLNKDTAALFLYYLKVNKVLPDYTDEDLASLALPFLTVSENTTRTKLGHIYDLRSDEKKLQKVKDMLLSLIKSIDEDLKKAKV